MVNHNIVTTDIDRGTHLKRLRRPSSRNLQVSYKRYKRRYFVQIPKEFTLFPRLPIELRFKIWEASIEARIVTVDPLQRDTVHGPVNKSAVWQKVPAILHTHEESRCWGLRIYRLSFAELLTVRPAYFNFSLDTLSILPWHISRYPGVELIDLCLPSLEKRKARLDECGSEAISFEYENIRHLAVVNIQGDPSEAACIADILHPFKNLQKITTTSWPEKPRSAHQPYRDANAMLWEENLTTRLNYLACRSGQTDFKAPIIREIGSVEFKKHYM